MYACYALPPPPPSPRSCRPLDAQGDFGEGHRLFLCSLAPLFPKENGCTTWLRQQGVWAALSASLLAAVRFWARLQRPKEQYMSTKACRSSPSCSSGSSVASTYLVVSCSTLLTALQHKQRCGGSVIRITDIRITSMVITWITNENIIRIMWTCCRCGAFWYLAKKCNAAL